jgi:hypothetical protein
VNDLLPKLREQRDHWLALYRRQLNAVASCGDDTVMLSALTRLNECSQVYMHLDRLVEHEEHEQSRKQQQKATAS